MVTEGGLKMVSKWIALAVYIVLGCTESAFVDKLSKCALKDVECQKNLIQKVIVDYSQTGIPENDIPSFDPFKMKDITVSLLGLLNVTIVEGEGVGIKDCIINSYNPNLEKGLTEAEVTCDLMVKGKFLVSGTSPVAENLFGGKTIHGDGDGELKLEKLHVGFTFFYDMVKKDDGEIYFSFMFNKTEFIYDVQNFNAKFDKIFLGEDDVSDRFVPYLNENWKFVFNTFGKSVFDVVLDIFHGMLTKLMNLIPASKIITDDLTPYIKNQ